jgi:hypothetical protein
MSANHQVIDTLWSGPNNDPAQGQRCAESRNEAAGQTRPQGAELLDWRLPHNELRMANPTSLNNTSAEHVPAAERNNGDGNGSNAENFNSEGQGPQDSPMAPRRTDRRLESSPNIAPTWTGYDSNSQTSHSQPGRPSAVTPSNISQQRIVSLPPDVQATLGYLDRRFIQTAADGKETETLDARES